MVRAKPPQLVAKVAADRQHGRLARRDSHLLDGHQSHGCEGRGALAAGGGGPGVEEPGSWGAGEMRSIGDNSAEAFWVLQLVKRGDTSIQSKQVNKNHPHFFS